MTMHIQVKDSTDYIVKEIGKKKAKAIVDLMAADYEKLKNE
jgi:hypothetical protein